LLLSNKTIQEKSSPLSKNDTLFELPERNEVSLFTEFKQADFFIKSTDNTLLTTLQNKLRKWPLISMCYRISLEKISSQSNQILE
jgi:DNA-directed RNA polymerase subunit L